MCPSWITFQKRQEVHRHTEGNSFPEKHRQKSPQDLGQYVAGANHVEQSGIFVLKGKTSFWNYLNQYGGSRQGVQCYNRYEAIEGYVSMKSNGHTS